MTIYEFVLKFDQETTHHPRNVKRQFAKEFPEKYSALLQESHLTPESTWKEILYCARNQIKEPPGCETCGGPVNWDLRTQDRYKRFCSPRCSIHIANRAARSEKAKSRRKQTVKRRYGEDNPSRVPEIKKKIRQGIQEHWEKFYSKTPFLVEEMTRKEYDRFVWRYTEWQYRTFIDDIDPDRKRGKDWHLDHIFSRSHGYAAGIPVEVIGSRHNLRLVPAKRNLRKSRNSEITLSELMEHIGDLNMLVSYAEAEELILESEKERKSILSSSMSKWRNSSEYREQYYKTCDYCGTHTDPGNYAKHHGDRCRHRSP